MFHLIWNRRSSWRKSSGDGRSSLQVLMISSACGKSPALSHSTDGTRQRRLDANTDRSVRRKEEPQYFSRTKKWTSWWGGKREKEQFNRDLTRKLITGKLLIQFSFDMVNKRHGHVSPIVLLGIVSRGISTMDLATSHPRHRRVHIDVTCHPHCL